MVDVVQQLCIKSYEITAKNGDYFKAKQGQEYTTTKPQDNSDTITIFSNYWVKVPKKYFVIAE